MGWGKYVQEAANISCSVNWEEQSPNAMTYIVYLFAFGLVLPLGVIIFSYVHIINTMKKSKMRMGQISKAEGRVAYMVLIMIVAFIVAWSPYSICALLVQFGDPSLVSPAAGVVPALLAKSKLVGMKENCNGSASETYALGVSRFISQAIPNIVENNRIIVFQPGEIQPELTKHISLLDEERSQNI
ncbi:hypothetical protein NQ314_019521 [Rhamnusium bicolor]|uniref:G-protein coupled receptors family 1 profile domain-containing protein n=1 Tax=Rhamnusium bicolor TaxID=1586634 RepID=A0AAV8WNR9_9CUCU|nr:hypothetical protein NQ314_019521 [Rhamnusium bicolor]